MKNYTCKLYVYETSGKLFYKNLHYNFRAKNSEKYISDLKKKWCTKGKYMVIKDVIEIEPVTLLEVTYYDRDYEDEITVIAKEIRKVRYCGFTYFEIIAPDDKSIVINTIDLFRIKKEGA